MSEELKAGDKVQLKSGGPVMTIDSIGDYLGQTKAMCQWFDGRKPYSQTFTLTSLEKFDDPEED